MLWWTFDPRAVEKGSGVVGGAPVSQTRDRLRPGQRHLFDHKEAESEIGSKAVRKVSHPSSQGRLYKGAWTQARVQRRAASMIVKLADFDPSTVSFQPPSSLGPAGKKVTDRHALHPTQDRPLIRPPPLRLESTLQSFRPLVSYPGAAPTSPNSAARSRPSSPCGLAIGPKSVWQPWTPTLLQRTTNTKMSSNAASLERL